MLWCAAQILCPNWVAYSLSLWPCGLIPLSWTTLPLFSSQTLPWGCPNLMTPSSSRRRACPLASNWGNFGRVESDPKLPMGFSEASLSTAFYFNFPCLILPSSALVFLRTSPINPPHLPPPPIKILDVRTFSLNLTYNTFIANSTGQVFLFQPISFIFCFQSLSE